MEEAIEERRHIEDLNEVLPLELAEPVVVNNNGGGSPPLETAPPVAEEDVIDAGFSIDLNAEVRSLSSDGEIDGPDQEIVIVGDGESGGDVEPGRKRIRYGGEPPDQNNLRLFGIDINNNPEDDEEGGVIQEDGFSIDLNDEVRSFSSDDEIDGPDQEIVIVGDGESGGDVEPGRKRIRYGGEPSDQNNLRLFGIDINNNPEDDEEGGVIQEDGGSGVNAVADSPAIEPPELGFRQEEEEEEDDASTGSGTADDGGERGGLRLFGHDII